MVLGSFAPFCTSQDEGRCLQVKFVHILLKLTSSGLLGELSDIQLKLRKTVKIIFFCTSAYLGYFVLP